jgi:hypothetical protein
MTITGTSPSFGVAVPINPKLSKTLWKFHLRKKKVRSHTEAMVRLPLQGGV